MKLLVSRTLTFQDPWPDGVDTVDEVGGVHLKYNNFPLSVRGLAQRSYEFLFGLKLLWLSRRYDAIAVGRYGIWFPVFKHFLGLRQRVVMMDIEWKNPMRGRIVRIASRASVALCCFTRGEIERYSRSYGIPREKFAFLPCAFQRGDFL